MVGVVVTGHGGFAAGMAANVKMLAGSDAELKAVDFADGMDVEVFEKQLASAASDVYKRQADRARKHRQVCAGGSRPAAGGRGRYLKGETP